MNDLQAIRARVEATYAGEPVGRAVADVMFLLLENARLETELETAKDTLSGTQTDYQSGLKLLELYGGYSAFVHSCIRSGELPDTFEQYCKKVTHE